MSPVEELENRIKTLSQSELRELREWLAEYDADRWDRQIESDMKNGRLDAVADQALLDHRENRSTKL